MGACRREWTCESEVRGTGWWMCEGRKTWRRPAVEAFGSSVWRPGSKAKRVEWLAAAPPRGRRGVQRVGTFQPSQPRLPLPPPAPASNLRLSPRAFAGHCPMCPLLPPVRNSKVREGGQDYLPRLALACKLRTGTPATPSVNASSKSTRPLPLPGLHLAPARSRAADLQSCPRLRSSTG